MADVSLFETRVDTGPTTSRVILNTQNKSEINLITAPSKPTIGSNLPTKNKKFEAFIDDLFECGVD